MEDGEDVSAEINEGLQQEIDKMEWKIAYMDEQFDKLLMVTKKID